MVGRTGVPAKVKEGLLRSPLLLLAASFAAGILLARPGHAVVSSLAFLFAAAGVSFLLGLMALRATRERASAAFLLLSFVSAGGAASQLFERRFPPDHLSHLASRDVDLEDPVRLEARLITNPIRTSYGLQFDAAVTSAGSRGAKHQARGTVRFRVLVGNDAESMALADSLHLQCGDTIRVLALLTRPRAYRNPGSFDFRRWMESIADIPFVGTIKSPHLIEKLPGDGRRTAGDLLQGVRRHFLESIDRLYPPWSREGRTGAVLKAVLLGDRSSVDSDTIENFRRTGLYHLLVVSGLHVGLLALMAGLLLRRLPLSEVWRAAGVLLILFAYAALVEQRAPTLRALLMITVYLVGRSLYRQHSLLNAVGLAGLILLVARPPWLTESGFQLSFSAALIIAGLAVPLLEAGPEPLRRALRRLQDAEYDARLPPRLAQFRLDARAAAGWLQRRFAILARHPAVASGIVVGPWKMVLWAASVILFSAVLQFGLLLPMAETFHRVTYAGIGLNAVAIPVMTALLAIAVPTVLLAATVPALAVWPGKLLAYIMQGFFALTEWPGLPAWLSYRVPEPPLWVSAGFALAMVATAWTLSRARRAFWPSLMVLGVFGVLISSHPFAARLPRDKLEVTALDCGGGDAIFVVLPGRRTMLVDGCGTRTSAGNQGLLRGRRWDPGEDIVSNYLWSRGVTEIDVVVLTHAHQDHLGGLAAVLRNFSVGEFWHGANPFTPAYVRLLHEVDRLRISERHLIVGQSMQLGDATFEILWPPADRPVGERPSNDDSLVLRIQAADATVLLAGDISEEVERGLLAHGADLKSNVLKVAHHGSGASSSAGFLARVSPSVALVTGGSGGFSALPSPEVLERLSAVKARVFQTDANGAITVEMKSKQLAVRTFGSSPDHGAADSR